ncbi:MAG TPA: helix-turn-helix transcriptional regulator [Bacillota bacterium]|nr:helix-turn-helix transcriptional regulator [Bacillota bacterium]
MTNNVSYTIEEIAQILRVSKLTVYDLVKKGDLPVYRVGRQMRVDAVDLEAYKAGAKNGQKPAQSILIAGPNREADFSTKSIVISGQDISLDILANYLEKHAKGIRPLRSYVGSLNSLISLYRGEVEVVSTHLFDGNTGEYNIPYVQRILTGYSYMIINLISRWGGLYVQKGNPKNIQTWRDLIHPDIQIVNREKGSGARVLLDEQLRIHGISSLRVKGYEVEESNHLAVAGAISKGEADVGIGIEKAAQIVGVEFIPLIKERYDLVIIKSPQNIEMINTILTILRSTSFQSELQAIGGYDLSQTGEILFETLS